MANVLLCGHDALCTVYLGNKGLINWTDLNQHINKLHNSGKLLKLHMPYTEKCCLGQLTGTR